MGRGVVDVVNEEKGKIRFEGIMIASRVGYECYGGYGFVWDTALLGPVVGGTGTCVCGYMLKRWRLVASRWDYGKTRGKVVAGLLMISLHVES